MTAQIQADAVSCAHGKVVAFKPLDPLDAMLRGRHAQQPFWRWLGARVIASWRK